jgi:hypothetical protein
MRISDKRIAELQKLLKQHTGSDYDKEQAQQAGRAIIRFVIAKERRARELKINNKEISNENDN